MAGNLPHLNAKLPEKLSDPNVHSHCHAGSRIQSELAGLPQNPPEGPDWGADPEKWGNVLQSGAMWVMFLAELKPGPG